VFDATTILVSLAIVLPGLILAFQRSSFLVDYLFLVVAFNRLIRRYVDYQNGYFNQYSLISITPMVVGGLAVLVVFLELNRSSEAFSKSSLKVIRWYGAAIGLAFVIGFLNTRFGAIYALGDFIAPIGLLGFGAIYARDDQVQRRWCTSIVVCGSLVAAYGLWQFYVIPPWDAFWVQAVNFEGYLGTLESTKMTLFSSMADRGPCATFLCSCIIVALLRPNHLGSIRYAAAVLMLAAMLLTYSRTTVVQLASAVAIYPLINRGFGFSLVGITSVVILVFGETFVSALPSSEMVSKRVSTLSNVTQDGSFLGRLNLFRIALSESITEPFGLGLGSFGQGYRVAEQNSELGFGDSTGYVETLRTFGWLGTPIVVGVFTLLWMASQNVVRVGDKDLSVFVFRSWFISGLLAAFSGNWAFCATFFWVLGGYCLERSDEVTGMERESDDHEDERFNPDPEWSPHYYQPG
jgi:putative inorganic carbon (HCO3(-)) transporter